MISLWHRAELGFMFDILKIRFAVVVVWRVNVKRNCALEFSSSVSIDNSCSNNGRSVVSVDSCVFLAMAVRRRCRWWWSFVPCSL